YPGPRGLARLVVVVAGVELWDRIVLPAFARTAPSGVDQPRFRHHPFPLGSRFAPGSIDQAYELTRSGDNYMVYLTAAFTESRPEVLVEHIERYDFGLLVSHSDDGIVASHVPFVVDRDGDNLHLHAHLARPNPQVRQLARGGEVLAIFHGPHAYISPNWYGTGPSVPTLEYCRCPRLWHRPDGERWRLAAAPAAPVLRAPRGPEPGAVAHGRASQELCGGHAARHYRARHRRAPARRQIQAEPEPSRLGPPPRHRRARGSG